MQITIKKDIVKDILEGLKLNYHPEEKQQFVLSTALGITTTNDTLLLHEYSSNGVVVMHFPIVSDEATTVVVDLTQFMAVMKQLSKGKDDLVLTRSELSPLLTIANRDTKITLPLRKDVLCKDYQPQYQVTDETKVNDLVVHINQASGFTATDDRRPSITNVHVYERNQQLIVEATDSHRLYQYETKPGNSIPNMHCLINNVMCKSLGTYPFTKLGIDDKCLYVGNDHLDYAIHIEDDHMYPNLTKLLFSKNNAQIKAHVNNRDLQRLITTFTLNYNANSEQQYIAVIPFSEFKPSNTSDVNVHSVNIGISMNLPMTNITNATDCEHHIAFNTKLLTNTVKLGIDEWQLLFVNDNGLRPFILTNESQRITVMTTPVRI